MTDYLNCGELDTLSTSFKRVFVTQPHIFIPKIFYYFHYYNHKLYGDSEDVLKEKANAMHPRENDAKNHFYNQNRIFNMMHGICQLLQASLYVKPKTAEHAATLFHIMLNILMSAAIIFTFYI